MKSVLYSCPFVPAEWIEAHGLQACRVVPDLSEAAACDTQTGMCPHVRAFVGRVLRTGDATPVVFTTTCDQMRRAAELVQQQGHKSVFLMNVPATWQTPVAEQMYASELRRFSRFLCDMGGHKPSGIQRLTTNDTNKTNVRFVPLEGCLSVPSQSVRLAVAGGPLADDSSFYAQVAHAGGVIVLDATDTGERTRPAALDMERSKVDPIGELTRAYLAIPSIHHRPHHRLLTWLKREVNRCGARGLILRRYIWCDLWHAEARRIADEVGVPVLDLQIDGDSESTHARVASRIGSFIEMLGGRFTQNEC